MKLKTLMMGAGIAAMVAGGALAQDNSMEESADDSMATEPQTGMEEGMTGEMTDTTGMDGEVAQAPTFTSLEEMTVGDVVGFVAYDPEDNRIAEIDYVIEDGDGAKAVLGIGGFLGLGEYAVALPLTDFELREDGMSFVLSTDKETLKEQPEIDESTIESLPDETPVADLIADEAPAEEEPADTPAMDDASGSDAAAEAETDMEEAPADEGETTTEADPSAEGDATAEEEADADAEADAETDTSASEDGAEADVETETETSTQ
jgi:hypothetical protein